jgi:hypothetical protein
MNLSYMKDFVWLLQKIISIYFNIFINVRFGEHLLAVPTLSLFGFFWGGGVLLLLLEKNM